MANPNYDTHGFGTFVDRTDVLILDKAQPEVFKSIFHSLWWAVATLTTVGYGDIYPVTFFGRVFTFIILMIGVGIISSSSGIMVNALQKVIEEEKINDKKKANDT